VTTRYYYLFLNEKLWGLPQIDTLGILDAKGIRLNHSRDWPNPNIDLSYREFFQALKENPKLASFVGQPVQGVSSDAWIFITQSADDVPVRQDQDR
jgi:hypothetical protein